MRVQKTTTILKCGSCHFFNDRKICFKVGYSKEDINRGAYVHTLDHGIIKLNKIKNCPMRISKEEARRQIKLKGMSAAESRRLT